MSAGGALFFGENRFQLGNRFKIPRTTGGLFHLDQMVDIDAQTAYSQKLDFLRMSCEIFTGPPTSHLSKQIKFRPAKLTA